MQFINLAAQYEAIQEDIHRRINQVFKHARYIGGPEIAELEQKLAAYIGVKHCIGVSSGSDALLIALMACGIGAGDEVITTPFSFIASSSMAALLGATPVFVDIDPDTYNIDPNKIAAAITPKTKAILPVSLYGQCADLDPINAIAQQYNLQVIEDSAQSFGATYKGKHSCALTSLSCTSFFPAKPLGAYGDAGACFSSDDELAKKMRQISNHGQSQRYHHVQLGIVGRLDSLQAAILLAKYEIFPQEIKLRTQIAEQYSQLLKGYVKIPKIAPHNISVYAQYTIQVPNRDLICKKLAAEGIPTAVHYPLALHMQPMFAYLGYKPGDFPIAEKAAAEVMSLPMDAYLKAENLMAITEKLIAANKEVNKTTVVV